MKTKKKQIRERFRIRVLSRDKFKCFFCDAKKELDPHHITDRHLMPNGGYVEENGITVCKEHHMKCEEWHFMGSGDIRYSPEALYKLIGSSKEKAVEADR